MRFVKSFGFLAVILSFFSLTGLSQASVSPSPDWTIDSIAAPTNFSTAQTPECEATLGKPNYAYSGCDSYEVSAMNAGSEPTDGGPVTLTDTLPAGLTVQRIVFFLMEEPNTRSFNSPVEMNELGIGGHPVKLGFTSGGESSEFCTTVPVTTLPVQCTYSGIVPAGDWLRMVVYVTVNEGASGTLTNVAEVSGGGAPRTSTAQPGQLHQTNEINSAPAPFGLSNFGFYKAGLNGLPETQAGGHPYALTTTIDIDNDHHPGDQPGAYGSVEPIKDIVVDLPLGFAGSTLAAPECTEAQLDSYEHCPPDTVVGHLTTEPLGGETGTQINSPIWNIVPERGHPAEFGYIDFLKGTHIAGYASVVPTPQGYVLRFVAPDIPEVLLGRIVVTFYGDPAAEQAETRQQEIERKLGEEGVANPKVKRENPGVQAPFFTNPTNCAANEAERTATIWMDSWKHPARFEPGTGLIPTNLGEEADGRKLWAKATSVSPPVTGCNELQFSPQIGSQPTTHEADSPSGLEFEQRLPQTEVFGTNATPALKDTTIVFPAGMTVDPSSADGLGVCTNAQIGWEGPTLFDFTQNPPDGAGGCPENSKIGTLELETPLIPGKLYGEVFLAAQNENPFNSVFATYIVVNDPTTGVVLKLAGEVKLCASSGEVIDGKTCQAPGQITSTFDETPQLPFSNLKVHFFGGPRAEFATPPNCGIYTTSSELAPWSIESTELPATPFDNYVIDEDCAIGFAPAFTGGSTNLQAGAYTTFQASFERQDSDQELGGAEVNLPPGMLANITSVTQCGEAELQAEKEDASTGGCPANSQVGSVESGAGPGPNPLFVPGKVFWTGPYNGHGACTVGEAGCAPFGLAVVVSANPGPFHFGNVLVRQRIEINPLTAAVTDVSDPFPTFIDPRGANGQVNGIPIKLRRVDVEVNRPGFTFNPTNCVKETFKVGGDITSVSAQSKTLSTPFQVTNCGHLKFEPKLAVSTQARTSKADGASLTYKVTYPNVPQGIDADIKIRKSRTPGAAALTPHDAAEGVYSKTVPGKPRRLPRTVSDRARKGDRPEPPGASRGPRVFRVERRRSVPEPDHGPAGGWNNDRSGWRHADQERGHIDNVQGDPGQPPDIV